MMVSQIGPTCPPASSLPRHALLLPHFPRLLVHNMPWFHDAILTSCVKETPLMDDERLQDKHLTSRQEILRGRF